MKLAIPGAGRGMRADACSVDDFHTLCKGGLNRDRYHELIAVLRTGRIAFEHDPSTLDGNETFADFQGEPDILLDEQNSSPLSLHL